MVFKFLKVWKDLFGQSGVCQGPHCHCCLGGNEEKTSTVNWLPPTYFCTPPVPLHFQRKLTPRFETTEFVLKPFNTAHQSLSNKSFANVLSLLSKLYKKCCKLTGTILTFLSNQSWFVVILVPLSPASPELWPRPPPPQVPSDWPPRRNTREAGGDTGPTSKAGGGRGHRGSGISNGFHLLAHLIFLLVLNRNEKLCSRQLVINEIPNI